MVKLLPGLHEMLDGRCIPLLHERNILTIADFLRRDLNYLKQISNIDLIKLATIKTDLWKLVNISPITAFQHHEMMMEKAACIPTGIRSLDELLNGGFFCGNVIDVCGLSGSGKTQFYTTIALNWAINYGHQTFVVDTKMDFSGDRINRMLFNQGIQDVDKRKQIMQRIRVEKCNNPLQLIDILNTLLDDDNLRKKCKLLVIDSLPTLWFLFHGHKSSLGKRKLAILGELMRKLAVDHGIVIIVINIETRIIATKNGDDNVVESESQPDRNESDLLNRSIVSASSEITAPALGKHWKSICSLRLQLRKPYDRSSCQANVDVTKNQHTNQRIIRILKNNLTQIDIECMVHLTDAGIT